MRKHRIERNLAFPSEEFRARVRTAAKQRGFRTEQAFLIAACEHELERGDNTEAMDDLEARIVATLSNVAREVQALFTLVHTQVALTNCLLQYVLTCVAEPPEEVLPAARARAKLRYAKMLRFAGQEVATRFQLCDPSDLHCHKMLRIPKLSHSAVGDSSQCTLARWPPIRREDRLPNDEYAHLPVRVMRKKLLRCGRPPQTTWSSWRQQQHHPGRVRVGIKGSFKLREIRIGKCNERLLA